MYGDDELSWQEQGRLSMSEGIWIGGRREWAALADDFRTLLGSEIVSWGWSESLGSW